MTNIKPLNSFEDFCKRILKSKHGMWFGLLKPHKQKYLYNRWYFKSGKLTLNGQTPSLRKYLYEARKMELKFQQNFCAKNI